MSTVNYITQFHNNQKVAENQTSPPNQKENVNIPVSFRIIVLVLVDNVLL